MSEGIELDIVAPGGGQKFFASSEKLAARTRFGVEKALWRSGKDITAEFSRQVLAKDKRGRLYIRMIKGGARRRHIASAPGQTPANMTGNYRKSSGFSVDGAHQLTFGNSAAYAGHLEVGTSRMKARPGLGNSIKASERDIIRNLADGIEGAL